MAIVRIGSLTESADAERTAQTGSESITVPADAEIIIVGVHGWQHNANYFTDGAASPTYGMTLNSVALRGVPQGNTDNSAFMGALFYLAAPSTGTQTLAWDWLGKPNDAVRIVYGFYKGINIASAVRDSDGAQNDASVNSNMVTPSLTAQTGDLVVAWSWAWTDEASVNPTWTNASAVTNYDTVYGSAYGSWAEGSPTGAVVVTADWPEGDVDDGGICALVLTPAAGSAQYAYPIADR